MSAILIDTHVYIWYVNGSEELSKASQKTLTSAMHNNEAHLAAISLWEISMLYSRQKILLNQPCLNWIQHSLQAPGIYLMELTPEIVVDSCSLPNDFHGDPADRIITSTARILSVPLMTRDQKILNYGQQGFLECIKA